MLEDAAPAPAAQPADPLIGTHVGSFRIVRMLGRGGMGTVYLGEHPAIGSRVAIKFLHESMAADASLVRRFFDEARAVNVIGHENIVGVYDLSRLPSGRYCYVMEYLEGETLAARLRRGRLPPAAVLDVLLQLCDALQCAHERGVIHRDLKPENVFLVSRRGRPEFVKLVDFGIAKLRGAWAGDGPSTRAGVLVGTPEYMAPEQCDDRPVDARADVYALGVIAFELAAGRLPFTARAVPRLLLAHLQEAPPPPSSLAPVDPELERAILRALEKDPGRRFQDMAAMAEALRPVAARLGAEAPDPLAPPATPTPRRRRATPEPREPELTVIVRAGPVPRRLAVVELTRSGLFLRAEANLPPLFARVRIELAHRTLRAPVSVQGEVVRHVSPAEAAGFRMAPGYAVQLVDLAPEARAAVSTLADALRREPAPITPPPSAASAGMRLAALEARAAAGPYALLGLPPDSDFSEVRRAGRVLREELEQLAAHPLGPDQPGRAGALLDRVQLAVAALGAPAARLALDGRGGNWRGVRRCLAAGVSEALVQARRR
ncbi:MAG TPA: serine/threonine-protein kinase, partial [Anaeromyxobacteraceae bacterium]|nr:serine/threonine-protein kinase [Anaeromyxobacteraceae bacterium]